MKYITADEAGDKWGMTASRVRTLAREGRVSGARLVGRSWLIPERAERPLDGRTRQAKKDNPSKPSPHFPLYLYGIRSEEEAVSKLDADDKGFITPNCSTPVAVLTSSSSPSRK